MLWLLSSFIIGLFYAILLGFYRAGWNRLTLPDSQPEKFTRFSVLIPFRNEFGSIQYIFNDLIAQNYPRSHYQLIFINDHSTDGSREMADNFKSGSNLIVHHLPCNEQGKKAAIKAGIQLADGDYIITTDADCRMSSDWLRSLNCSINASCADMLLGPVTLEGKGLLCELQKIEFGSLMAITGGSAGIGRPVLSNGANMVVKREILASHFNLSGSKLETGDDVFTLEACKRSGLKIQFIKSKDAIVSTGCCTTILEFWHQRLRWSSKARHYTDHDIIFSGLIVAVCNFMAVILSLLAVMHKQFLSPLLLFIGIKFLAELILILPVLNFFNQKSRSLILPALLIYPYYALFFAVSGLFFRYKWKERTFPNG